MAALMLLLLCLGTAVVHGSGLTMCQGPFQLPEFVDVSVNQVSDEEVKVKVVMISNATMLINWGYFPEGYWTGGGSNPKGIRPSPDSDTFRASTNVSGNRYTLEVQLKPEENLTSSSDYLYQVRLYLDLNYSCNVVSLSLSLFELTQDNLDLPVITEMPRQRATVDGNEVYEVKVGVTYRKGMGTKSVFGTCSNDLQRRAGRLGPPVIKMETGYFYAATTDTQVENEEKRLSESVCKVDMRGDLEVAYGSHRLEFLAPRYGGIRYKLSIPYEVRRKGLDRPAIFVANAQYNPASKTRYTIITSEDEVESFCVADADIRPTVRLTKIKKDGGLKAVADKHVRHDLTYLSRTVLNFTVKSPDVLETDEYACVAYSDAYRRGAKERFTIMRSDKARTSQPE